MTEIYIIICGISIRWNNSDNNRRPGLSSRVDKGAKVPFMSLGIRIPAEACMFEDFKKMYNFNLDWSD